MHLRTRLANFLVFIGVIALAIFALDVTSFQEVKQWGALLVGLAALGLGIVLRPGRIPTPPARPNAPPPAQAKSAGPPPKPAAAKPAPPKPAGGLSGLFKPKPKSAPPKPAPAGARPAPPAGKPAKKK